MSDEFFREYCMRWHAETVRAGYFLAARHILRRALKFRRGGRVASIARDYFFYRGKVHSCYWGN